VPGRGDVRRPPDHPLRDQEPEGEVEVVSRGPHRHRERSGLRLTDRGRRPESDLQWFLDRQGVGSGRSGARRPGGVQVDPDDAAAGGRVRHPTIVAPAVLGWTPGRDGRRSSGREFHSLELFHSLEQRPAWWESGPTAACRKSHRVMHPGGVSTGALDPRPDDATAETARGAVAAHRADRGPLLPVLHDVQAALGHVPSEAVPVIAAELNLSRADVHGVVSFYADFRRTPPGRTVIALCRAEACQAVGADALADQVEAAFGIETGSTSTDGAVTLNHAYCLGNCALGPSAMVDGRLVGRATADRLVALVRAAAGGSVASGGPAASGSGAGTASGSQVAR
jgi:formate dehydrogenase subunit gamma